MLSSVIKDDREENLRQTANKMACKYKTVIL